VELVLQRRESLSDSLREDLWSLKGSYSHRIIDLIEKQIQFHGETMPHLPGQIHFPVSVSKKDLLEVLQQDLDETIPKSSFYQILNQRFPHVKFPSACRFSKCTTCLNLREQISKTVNPQEKEELRRLMAEHNDQQLSRFLFFLPRLLIICLTKHFFSSLQRHLYSSKVNESLQNSEKVTSIIIDGMDQAKTRLVKHLPLPKGCESLPYLKTHILGVKVGLSFR